MLHVCNTLQEQGSCTGCVALLYRPGAVSFQNLRTIKHVPCPTFEAAAVPSGVLEDDTEHYRCLEEAAVFATACQTGAFLVDILINADGQDPVQLWEADKLYMVDARCPAGDNLACFSCFCLCLRSLLGTLNFHFFCFLFSVPLFFADAQLPMTASVKDLDEAAL